MDRRLRIEIHTRDIRLRPDIFGSSITLGQQARVAEGIVIRNEGGWERRSVDVPAILHFTLEFADQTVEGIGVGLAAAWLYDKVKGRVKPARGDEMLVIERTEVELEEGEIRRVITEKLSFKR